MANIYGTTSGETLNGTLSSDNIYGYGGSDTINASNGNDYVSAGDGSDIVDGGDGNDQIYGGNQDDSLVGNLGNDVISGDAGNDTLVGGLGDDQLYGGVGVDSFLVDGVTGWDSYTGGDSFYNNNPLTPHIDAIILQTINPYAVWGEIKISFLSGIERIAKLMQRARAACDILNNPSRWVILNHGHDPQGARSARHHLHRRPRASSCACVRGRSGQNKPDRAGRFASPCLGRRHEDERSAPRCAAGPRPAGAVSCQMEGDPWLTSPPPKSMPP